jgi:ribosomal protein L10
MSKLVKNMLVDDLRSRLDGVGDVIVVSVGRLDAVKTALLRQTLRKKRIHLQLVKNSLARRATAGTPLAPAFSSTEGMLAIAWGAEDVVDLAKELDRLTGVKDFEGFECRGGALDGSRLEAADVKRVAKWPTGFRARFWRPGARSPARSPPGWRNWRRGRRGRRLDGAGFPRNFRGGLHAGDVHGT